MRLDYSLSWFHGRGFLEGRNHSCLWNLLNSFVKANALEEFEWNLLENKSPDKFSSSESKADVVLLSIKSMSLDDLSSNLNKSDLNSNCEEDDKNEEPVVEHALEDIHLSLLDLSSVNLIEELHEDEDLEDECEMQELLSL